MLTGTALASDIQIAWDKAAAMLPCADPDPSAIAELIAALRDCADRAKAIGFYSGERELLRMARALDGRIAPTISRYGADGLIARF